MRDRQAVQRAQPPPLAASCVGARGVGQRPFGDQRDDGVHRRVDPLDPGAGARPRLREPISLRRRRAASSVAKASQISSFTTERSSAKGFDSAACASSAMVVRRRNPSTARETVRARERRAAYER